ncbi:MAG: MFS transporter [Alphaproteobacteria bacterium]|nr:MFS transporter [Alphaproteobacteria bacterium]
MGGDAEAHSRPLKHLLATFTTQSLAACGFIAFVLIAPNLAAATGLPERDFGLAVTFIFIGTALSSAMTSTYMRWFGSVGTQALTLVWMGGAFLIVYVGSWSATMLAAFLFGLGYGPLSPISMTIVTERTPQKNRGLFLAVRQSSQPLAGVVLGRALPPLMIAYGWQAGVLTISVVVASGFLIIWLWPSLFRLRDERAIRRPVIPAGHQVGLLRSLAARLTIPANLRVLWFAGIIFAITQVGMVFFTYIYMLEEIKLSPIEAGIFASNLQVAGLFGRPVFGWFCDRLGRTDVILISIALISIAASYGLLIVETDWSAAAFLILALACGFSGQAWNAVFTAAMAEHVPREKLAEMNGRAFAFLSIGWMSGGPFCWLLIELFDNYRPMYVAVIGLNVMVAVMLSIWALRKR